MNEKLAFSVRKCLRSNYVKQNANGTSGTPDAFHIRSITYCLLAFTPGATPFIADAVNFALQCVYSAGIRLPVAADSGSHSPIAATDAAMYSESY
ncbi:hypothetical protein H5410_063449 [Solanum commersonii]|uniref:Uncharacterized protein n=1 Tax=Solanum commersonii TaxID=4109 RepID=A0A9J5WD99_SOLCO|nr:hypothetical protein H5410_063449 [Solanum commersonii]